jgi:hypothetical protein
VGSTIQICDLLSLWLSTQVSASQWVSALQAEGLLQALQAQVRPGLCTLEPLEHGKGRGFVRAGV